MTTDRLTPAEEKALCYEQIIDRYQRGCDCPPCRVIAMLIEIPVEG